jgi:hypothetical protein
MKNSTLILATGALIFAVGAVAIAQDQTAAPRPRPHRGPPGDPAQMVAHLSAAYAKFAPFDENKDGRLDETELEVLAEAIAAGTVQPPEHRGPPPGVTPDPKLIVHRLAGMFATVAPYDANQDGKLDETEQAALKTAIENGELPRPGGPRGGRPHGARGPRA